MLTIFTDFSPIDVNHNVDSTVNRYSDTLEQDLKSNDTHLQALKWAYF